MLKTLACLAALAAFAAPAFAATDDELRQALVGSWSDQQDCTKGVLEFHADGTFISKSTDNPDDGLKGTYEVNGGVLTGKSDDGQAMPNLVLTSENGTLFIADEGGTNKGQLYACAE